MPRSKVPAGQPVGFPSQWQPQSESDGHSQEHPPQQWPNGAQQNHNPYVNPDPRYAQPATRPQPAAGYPANGGYQPPYEGQSLSSYTGSPYHQPAAPPAYAPPPAQRPYDAAPAGYGSQFDPPPQHAPQHGYDHQPAAPAADYGLNARLGQGQAYGQAGHGGQHYDQWNQGGRDQEQREARNYDLGSYLPQHEANPQESGQARGHAEPSWGHGADAYGLQGDPRHGGYGGQQNALEAVDPSASFLDHDHEDTHEGQGEERRRGTSKFVIVGALVGAIGLGGGLAYAYKTLMIPTGSDSPPIIKADKKPSKLQPSDPGGKQFANKDNKLLGRLGEEGESAAKAAGLGSIASSAGDDPAGARKVVTYPVARDGSILPPASQPFPNMGSQQAGVVLGTVVSDGYGNRAPTTPVVTSSTPTSAPLPLSQQGRMPGLAKAPAAEPPAKVAAIPADVPRKPLPPKQLVAAAPAVAAPAAVAVKGGTNGFVAVLTSQKSRMDALKSFADLQQRYAPVLQDKTPDVVEADLSSRGLGMMYRAVVGPPGSREAANDVCGRLKSAGYTNCWVTTY